MAHEGKEDEAAKGQGRQQDVRISGNYLGAELRCFALQGGHRTTKRTRNQELDD